VADHIHPNDKAEALWAAILNMEAHQAEVTMSAYHLHILRQLHADAVREARK